MAEAVDLGELIGRVVSLCEGAADLIREAYRGGGDLQTRFKDGVSDPVTIADLRAQRYVHGSLEAAYPALTLIGEEDDATVAHLTDVALADGSDSQPVPVPAHLRSVALADLVVWVDPLDGTRSFVERRPADVTTMVGIAHRGSPLAGIITFPLDDARPAAIWGGPQLGLHGLTPVPRAVPAGGARPAVGLSYWVANDVEKLAAVHEALPEPLFELDASAGGMGHLCVLLLEGRLDAVRGHGFKWDTAAPAALLGAVGGMITDMDGGMLSYHREAEQENRGGVIASVAEHWRYVGHAGQVTPTAIGAAGGGGGGGDAVRQARSRLASAPSPNPPCPPPLWNLRERRAGAGKRRAVAAAPRRATSHRCST